MSDPKWKNDMMEEMNALIKNNTWDFVTLPTNQKVVGCRWVFSVKQNADGSVERYKARLIAQGLHKPMGLTMKKPLLQWQSLTLFGY